MAPMRLSARVAGVLSHVHGSAGGRCSENDKSAHLEAFEIADDPDEWRRFGFFVDGGE